MRGKAGFHEEDNCASNILDKKRLSNNGKLGRAQPHPPQQPQLRCPECGSSKIWKDGLHYTSLGPVQRYICRNCAYRFSDPHFQCAFNGSDMSRYDQRILTKLLKSDPLTSNCQICATKTTEVLNLVKVEARQEKPKREGTKQTINVKGKIVEFMWKMQKNGRRLSTVKNYSRVLNVLLNSGVNLLDVEEVKAYLASAEIKLSSKKQYTDTLKVFYKTLGIQWQPPEYKGEPEIPFIPTEKELDQFVAAVGKKLGTFLQLLKETGARPGEIQRLTWANIDFERRTVRIKPLKGSLPRILPISLKAIEMLKNLPKKSERIFARVIYGTFDKQRRNAAKKLANPRILQIHFHTFRHWKATMEYHKTKDILYVKQLLGHKNIQNTLIYITMEKALFQHGLEEEFHVRVAQKPEEIKAFLEAGFDYVLQKDGLAFFRKRK